MILDYGSKTINLKIVFFGPAMSGKTTSIRFLFSNFGLTGQLTSIENSLGRTMFCDYGTLELTISSNWTIRAHIWTATGQDFYRSTREVVLSGTDGILFVADSNRELLNENVASWNELMSLIAEEDRVLPVVILLNKQDLPNAIQAEELRKHLTIPSSIALFCGVAKDGKNVMEAFQHLFQKAMHTSLLTTTSY